MIIRIFSALALTLAMSATAHAANVGAKYGARDPRACSFAHCAGVWRYNRRAGPPIFHL